MQGRLQNPSEFENIILRTNNDGSFLRLKDVADVEIGSQQYSSQGRLNGNDAVPIMIKSSIRGKRIAYSRTCSS